MATYDASTGVDPWGRDAASYSAANGNYLPGGGYGANDMSGNAASLAALRAMYGGGTPAAGGPTNALSVASGSTGGGVGGGGATVAGIAPPALTPFHYSNDAMNYPTYMRGLGEQLAANNFKSQVTRGIRAGGSSQALTHAQDAQNLSRLTYMGQAGQAQVSNEKNQADELQRYQQLLMALYGTQVTEEGHQLSYQAALAQAAARGGSGAWNSTGRTGFSAGGSTGAGAYYPLGNGGLPSTPPSQPTAPAPYYLGGGGAGSPAGDPFSIFNF